MENNENISQVNNSSENKELQKKKFPVWLIILLICLFVLPFLCMLGGILFGRTMIQMEENKNIEDFENYNDKEESTFLIEENEIADYLNSCILSYDLEEEEFFNDIETRENLNKFEGMEWFNEEQEIELLKDYYKLYFGVNYEWEFWENEESIKAFNDTKEYLEICINQLEEFFISKNFSSNKNNGYAFEKDSFKCSIRVVGGMVPGSEYTYGSQYMISCGDSRGISTQLEIKEIYKFLEAHKNFPWDWSKDINILNIVEDYALVSHSMEGGKILHKNVDGWREIASAQDYHINIWTWDCQNLFDSQVPPSLFDYEVPEGNATASSSCFNYLLDGEFDSDYSYQEFYFDNI